LPVFIALKPDIEQHDEGKITCSYQWFRTLINRHISTGKKEDLSVDKKEQGSNDYEGFQFNSATQKEELV